MQAGVAHGIDSQGTRLRDVDTQGGGEGLRLGQEGRVGLFRDKTLEISAKLCSPTCSCVAFSKYGTSLCFDFFPGKWG